MMVGRLGATAHPLYAAKRPERASGHAFGAISHCQFVDGSLCTYADYALVSGADVREVNQLEIIFNQAA